MTNDNAALRAHSIGDAGIDVTVGIGRNAGAAPMAAESWARFQLQTATALASGGQLVAEVRGEATSADWAPEESVWYAGSVAGARELARLRSDLAQLAGQYGQDAIALTVGACELVTAAPTYAVAQ